MEGYILKKIMNDLGQFETVEFSGLLVLKNAESIKNELFIVVKNLNNKVRIVISDVQDIDISFIQLILAFIQFMDNNHIAYKFEWNLSDELQTLLENVGFSNELFLN